MLRPELEAAALGLLQGPAELLPISSSAHVAAVPWLFGWGVAGWPPARRKELEVALHAGAAAALAPALIRALPRFDVLALSLAPPVILGYALERPVEERLGGPVALAAGLLAGAAALAVADRAPQRRRVGGPARSWPARRSSRGLTGRRSSGVTDGRSSRGPTGRRSSGVTAVDAVWLGLAQAAALAPGVSRTGATLAAARARGFARPDAAALSFGVAGPVLAGATALKAWRLAERRGPARPALIGAAAAFASTWAAARLIGVRRRAPLWPWAAERAALAGAILAVRYRRGR